MQATVPSRVIAGAVLPRSTAWTVGLVVGFALLTAAAAQIRISLPFTPVPITGQTFAVLLAGASLGSIAGSASQLLYVALGAVGLPFYAGGESGWEVFAGTTGGYLVGFVVAAWIVGFLAERSQDRTIASAVPAFLSGSLVIYLFGVPWLAHALDVGWVEAAGLGAVPFVIGDLVKAALAGTLLPLGWKLANRH
jgi:biotin transport system substrate-specific component